MAVILRLATESESSLGIGEYDAIADRRLVNAMFDSNGDDEDFAGFNAVWVESRTLARPVLRDADADGRGRWRHGRGRGGRGRCGHGGRGRHGLGGRGRVGRRGHGGRGRSGRGGRGHGGRGRRGRGG